jgi:hypothetical protein
MNMTANSAGFAGTAVAGDDLDLVHATQNGDVSAFGQLVGRYDRKLLRIAHHVTHDPRYTNHAERTVHLFDGRIIEETKPTSLRSYAAEPRSPTC